MSTKLTIIILLSTALTIIHCIFGCIVIKDETNKEIITLCQYIWIYNFFSTVSSAFQTLFGLYVTVFTILITDTKKKKCIISYLIEMALLIAFGTIIYIRTSTECSNIYMNNYPQTWQYFTITYRYAVSIWCIFILTNFI